MQKQAKQKSDIIVLFMKYFFPVICIAALVYGCILLVPEIRNRRDASAVKGITDDQLSDEAVGRIIIDNTSINYPIMQGENNFKYLNTSPTGENSLVGSIFLDYRNSSDFSDDYSIIYGHHMKGDYMFGPLEKFLDMKYLQNHRTGLIELSTHEFKEINVFACLVVPGDDANIFELDYCEDLWAYIQTHTDVFMEYYGGKIVALTTCKDTDSDDRIIVMTEILESSKEVI